MAQIESVINGSKNELANSNIFYAHDTPVMNDAYLASELLRTHKEITIHGIDQLIPNAVSVANILNEKIRQGNCKIANVMVDSELDPQQGKMLSIITIRMTGN
ncbi:MAG: hypothetical protein R1F52_07915 [Candidatus Nitrosoabyssus spongiisocia]|nr:MAG: hypothetical protein R1F52_07915 [Nitrosopumilaceae archaeon AB1(1)]